MYKDLQKLTPIELIGVFRLAKVPVIDATGNPRPFTDVFADFLAALSTMNRKRRRELLSIIHDAAKEGR